MKLRLGDQRKYQQLKKKHIDLRRSLLVFPILTVFFASQAYRSFLGLQSFLKSGISDPVLLKGWIINLMAFSSLVVGTAAFFFGIMSLYFREKHLMLFLQDVVKRQGKMTHEPKTGEVRGASPRPSA